MNHIKLFEEFNWNKKIPDMVKTSTSIKCPIEPFKRNFTDDEREAMYKYFPMFSWSKIDSNGEIILGGGEEACGKYYITEDDLLKLL